MKNESERDVCCSCRTLISSYSQSADLVGEFSSEYARLVALEKHMDHTLADKAAEMQEAQTRSHHVAKKLVACERYTRDNFACRTLRLYISHVLEAAETREQTWTLRIEGRVVEAV